MDHRSSSVDPIDRSYYMEIVAASGRRTHSFHCRAAASKSLRLSKPVILLRRNHRSFELQPGPDSCAGRNLTNV
jgi:hypothetical protein